MDAELLRYFKTKERPIDKIHKELFESTPECKYYNLGMAISLSSLYKVFKEYKYSTIGKDELLEALKISADQNKDIHYYFYNLIEE